MELGVLELRAFPIRLAQLLLERTLLLHVLLSECQFTLAQLDFLLESSLLKLQSLTVQRDLFRQMFLVVKRAPDTRRCRSRA